jgi:exopolyphosphatase/guanosine-5'-triphosphate,3'-diphosphate pyrophosphatase
VSAGRSRLAIVDIGSNSVRLFLCEGAEADGPAGERLSTVTGLRRGAAPDGAISDGALRRLDECLDGYAGRVGPFAPSRVIAVGTSAVRDAPNRERVAAIVRARLGAPLTILAGEQEAALAFAGARLGAPGDGSVLVVDIGGGSTELVRGTDAPGELTSLQLGAVRQTERHLMADPPSRKELEALRAEALEQIAGALVAFEPFEALVGVAGTITTLAAIELGGYDRDRVHRHVLARATVEALLARLAAMPAARRREVPGLEPARAGVIVAGAAITAAVLEASGRDAIVVSERDLLDGATLAAWDPPPGVFRL